MARHTILQTKDVVIIRVYEYTIFWYAALENKNMALISIRVNEVYHINHMVGLQQ